MKTFKQYFEEATDYSKAIWITPKGETIKLNEYETHEDYAYRYPEDFNLDKHIFDNLRSSMCSGAAKHAVMAGGVRIHISGKHGTVVAFPPAYASHRREILNIMMENGVDEFIYYNDFDDYWNQKPGKTVFV